MIALAFVGQTGSGKTTLAKSVAETLKLERIGSGDIAREMALADVYTRADLERGQMAPEAAMRAEVQARIEAATIQTGDFVIEGFPRMLAQLYIFESVPGIRPLYFALGCDPLICLRRLIQRNRENDHPDAVATRFRFYDEQTEPMLYVISSQTIELDGSLPIETLTEQVAAEYWTEQRRG